MAPGGPRPARRAMQTACAYHRHCPFDGSFRDRLRRAQIFAEPNSIGSGCRLLTKQCAVPLLSCPAPPDQIQHTDKGIEAVFHEVGLQSLLVAEFEHHWTISAIGWPTRCVGCGCDVRITRLRKSHPTSCHLATDFTVNVGQRYGQASTQVTRAKYGRHLIAMLGGSLQEFSFRSRYRQIDLHRVPLQGLPKIRLQLQRSVTKLLCAPTQVRQDFGSKQ